MIDDQSLLNFFGALTKSERRYFTIRNKNQKPSDHLNLYDILKNGLIPKGGGDKKIALPTKIKGVRNISRAKRKLYDEGLKSLREQYDKTFIEDEVNQDICEANLLKKKGLTQQSAAHYAMAKQKAIRFECHYQHCAIIDRQRILGMNKFKKNTRNDVLSLHEEKKRVLEQINQLDFFEEKRHRAMLLYRLNGHLRDEKAARQAEELLYELLDNQYKATTFFAQIACFNGLTLLYRLKQENKTTLYYFQEILKLWERPEYEHFRKAYQDLYKLDVYNYLGALQTIGAFDEYENILAKLAPYRARFLEEEVEDFQNVHFYLFLKYLNKNHVSKAQEQVKLIDAKIDEYSERVEGMIDSRLITLKYNIAIFYFIQDEFDTARTWFLRILYYTNSQEQRTDLRYLCPIFLLIIAYELGDQEKELDRMPARFTKYLQRKDSYYTFEKQILTYLKKLIVCTKTEQKKIFAEMEKELETILQKRTLRNGVEETLMWIKSRLNDQPMTDYL